MPIKIPISITPRYEYEFEVGIRNVPPNPGLDAMVAASYPGSLADRLIRRGTEILNDADYDRAMMRAGGYKRTGTNLRFVGGAALRGAGRMLAAPPGIFWNITRTGDEP